MACITPVIIKSLSRAPLQKETLESPEAKASGHFSLGDQSPCWGLT